jgi:2'-hydroxyisoflavone reductase
MKLLILGGTIFLGRHLVEAALARGHEVTLFNRGTRPLPWPDVEQLIGDRDIDVAGGLDALDGRRFDAVVDTSGYVPRLVGASAAKLADAVEHYTFVSSVSVYRDLSATGIAESGALKTMDDPTDENVMANYGALKALCERAAEAAMPGRCLHVRAGLIVGPFDETGRFAYWLRRVAEGGEVLAPGRPDRPIQFIDVRDLVQWIVAMAEDRRAGTYNATGPAERLTMEDLLVACRSASGSDAHWTWVDDAFLVEQGVVPFTNLPLWLPPEVNGLLEVDVSKAMADGLRCRPLASTIADTMAWLGDEAASSDVPAPTFGNAIAPHAGLSAERERALLDAWAAADPFVIQALAWSP